MNFLILPVQRLPRYVLLLRDLLKFTPEEHTDFENLSKAVDKMSSVADYVCAVRQLGLAYVIGKREEARGRES